MHHRIFARMLSDVHGIQVRGCPNGACAPDSADIATGVERGNSGWVRLGFNYLHADADADRIIPAVADLARKAPDLVKSYARNSETACFTPTGIPPEGFRPDRLS